MTPLSRRQVLLAGLGGLVLAACGDDDNGSGATTTTVASTTSAPEVAGGLALRKVFSPQQPIGVDVRLPLAVSSDEGHFDIDLPTSVRVALTPPGGTAGEQLEIARRDQGIPTPYFPLRTRLDQPGRWLVSVTVGDVVLRTTLDAVERSQVPAVPGPGDRLPNLATPTATDTRGVEPICTREPQCPFHRASLDQAIGGSGPIALLVSTPKFCRTAICGPVLDLVVERQEQLTAGGVTVVHAEVYVDERAKETTEIVQALGLSYEPALFLAAPDGTVTDRLDYTFDGTELDESLAKLVP